MRGYVPQYDLAARLIYEAIASGELRWIGLADPKAGKFDDIVLGFEGLVVAYQVKSSRDPDQFRLETLLFHAPQLWAAAVDAWARQRGEHGNLRIQLRYATDNFPDTDDHLEGSGAKQISSAALLRAHETHRGSWTLGKWRSSPFAEFIEKLLAASGLIDHEFFDLWRNLSFETGGSSRLRGLRAASVRDQQRQDTLAALLPKLIAEANDKRRWSTDELLARLNWRDPFRLRRSHTFPTDLLTQANAKTEAEIQQALQKANSGYVSLVGPPGSGKSTLLQAGMVPVPNAIFVRYLAFIPDGGHGLGRAEATDFLHDIIVQLKAQRLGSDIMPGLELAELQQQFERMLGLAGERYARTGRRTIIIVDGLDHIPREEQPQHSLLRELPQPHAIPQGVIFLLGTQKLDLSGLPRAVRDQAEERRINIAPLPREAIYRLAEASKLPPDVDRDSLYNRSEGHPLAARYLIEGLARLPTEAERTKWLSDEPKLGGNAEVYYERAWHDIEDDPDAQLVLSYLALAEGAIDPFRLDEMVGRAPTDRAKRAALHLFRLDKAGRWSIFHNSFRLFLLERTSMRHGRRDEEELRRQYNALAEMARHTDGDDQQKWMELRYRSRAEDERSVLALATPSRFRRQFIEGRNPGDIQVDIRFAFAATRKTRDVTKFFELLLCRHEMEMRTDAISSENIVDAYIAAGDLDGAQAALEVDRSRVPVKARYAVIEALLEAGRFEEARGLFEAVEPIDKLLGWGQVYFDRNDDELYEWAQYVLIFREPHQFLAALDRLQVSEVALRQGNGDLEAVKRNLRLFAARSALDAAPEQDFEKLCKHLFIEGVSAAALRLLGAEGAMDSGADDIAKVHLEKAFPSADEFSDDRCLRAARVALHVGDKELAKAYFSKVVVPSLRNDRLQPNDWVVPASRAILSYSTIETQLWDARREREYPDAELLKPLQEQLEAVGRLLGKGRAGQKLAPDVVWHEVQQLLMVMAYAEGASKHDLERWELNKVASTTAGVVVEAAAAHGTEALALVVSKIDHMLETNPGRIDYPTFRRPYAAAVYRHEWNTPRALARLPAPSGIEGYATPGEYVSEVCEQSIETAYVGDRDGARQMLRQMREAAFGISLPPRKDGQYEMWIDLLERASAQNPERRAERVRCYARLLEGLSQTEGSGAAHRVAPLVVEEAALASPGLASAVFDKLDAAGISSWPSLVSSLLTGLTKARPDLAVCAAIVFNHMVLPFTDDFSDNLYGHLLKVASPSDKKEIVEQAIERIAVDANATVRLPFLENLGDLARVHGIPFPVPALARWKAEHVEAASSCRESPYAWVVSLEALQKVLVETPPDADKSYGAVSAFRRVAPTADYAKVRAIMAHPVFADDERAMLTAARAAIAAGKPEDARAYVDRLRPSAERDGSWGQWQSGAKLRLHRLLTELGGDAAKERAFHALAQDLSRGREWSGSLIPDIATILEVVSVKPDWPAIWDRLAEHLKVLRDFSVGTELGPEDESCKTSEDLIAKILGVGIELLTADLSRQVRFTARELIDADGGAAIVIALIERLWRKGGNFALEGIRIAWETRSSPNMMSYARSSVALWAKSSDLAVVRCAMEFASVLGVEVAPGARALPGFYELEFRDLVEATKFGPPAGFSSTTRGLWTEDPFSWTWPLERSLKVLARASGFGVPILRRRVAEVMRQDGGRELFGPEPIEAHYAHLTRLEMRLTYHRLPIIAAFRAAREAATELVRAERFDFGELTLFLDETAAPNPALSSIPPEVRPSTIIRPHLASSSWMKETEAWVNDEGELPPWPTVPGHRVLAAAGSFDITSMRRELVEEHLFLCGGGEGPYDSLVNALAALPRAVVLAHPVPLYDDISRTGVAGIAPDLAGSIPNYAMTLCPYLAREIDLHPHPKDPFSYLDEKGTVAVRSIWWRDGGLRLRAAVERAVRGDGYLVAVKGSIWPRIKPYLAESAVSYRWRHATYYDDGKEHQKSKGIHWPIAH